MQMHQVKPTTRPKREKRVGRGDKTAGRGTKGQKARAGAKIRPAIRDLLKKLPKRRGYRFRSFHPKPVVLNLGRLAAHFADGATVDASSLLQKDLIRTMGGRTPRVKILASGSVKKRLKVKGLAVSAAARAAIEAAGGTVR